MRRLSVIWILAATLGALTTRSPLARAREPVADRARLVYDRSDESYHEVIVEREGRVAQQLPLRDVPVLDGRQEARFADFDGDGRSDLVVLPATPGQRHAIWLVFRFDAKRNRFRSRPECFASTGWRALRSPGRDFRVERLIESSYGGPCVASRDIPAKRSALLVIHRHGEITQVLPAPKGDLLDVHDAADLGTSDDVDFDGHGDLVLGASGADNMWYQIWRFDPARKRFVFSPDLSNLANPTLLPSKHEIDECLNRGAAGDSHMEAHYRFIKGKLEKVWEADQDNTGHEPAATRKGAILYTLKIRQRIDGQMKLVCHALVDIAGSSKKPVKILVGDAASCAR